MPVVMCVRVSVKYVFCDEVEIEDHLMELRNSR
jgi:hypothetical protein